MSTDSVAVASTRGTQHILDTTPARTHAARLDWLRARPDLLAQLPSVTQDPDLNQLETLDMVLRGMQIVRLYPSRTRPDAVRWAIRLLVSELRGEPVSEKDRQWALRGASRD